MKNKILLTICTLILGFAFSTSAQETAAQQVANYSIGKYGQANYEHFSFWTNEAGKPASVQYRYGKDAAELNLTYSGASQWNKSRGFEVKFPDGKVYFVAVNANKTIKVTDKNGKYNKILKWEYEGPINGIGTFCQPCTQNATAANQLLKSAYL